MLFSVKKYFSPSVILTAMVALFISLYFLQKPKEIKEGLGAIQGDVNGDGVVDIIDFQLLSNTFGKSSGQTGYDGRANFNGDTTVDILDFQILSNNFGQTAVTNTPTIRLSNTPTIRPTNSPTPRLTVTPTIRLTVTPTLRPTPTTSASGVTCASLSGIEKKFPCSPLTVGLMPANVSSGTDAWDMFLRLLYNGYPNMTTDKPYFSAVANPVGSGVVVKNQNVLSDAEKHTTVGTLDDLPYGSTSCSAFRWLWKDASELPQVGWLLVWQLQMQGSPTVAIETGKTTHDWFFRTRNGSDTGLAIHLADIVYGHWAYFVICTHLEDAPGGWTKIWFRYDGWPDVNVAPFYERSGHDTWQGTAGTNTIGIYAEHPAGSTASYYGYFDRFGRATTPQRAVSLAGNP